MLNRKKKAEGGGKNNWKTSSTKEVRECVSEKVTSQERHPWQERRSFQKICVQDQGRRSEDVSQLSC